MSDADQEGRPLAMRSEDSRGPSYDAAVERSEAAFAAVRRVLGTPTVLDNVADLAALTANLPPELPLFLDDIVRAAPNIPDGTATVLAVVAEWVTMAGPPQTPVRDLAGQEHDVLEPALQLGLRVLPTDMQPPRETDCRAYCWHDRAVEALDNGETSAYLASAAEVLRGIAGDLEDKLAQWLPYGEVPAELTAQATQLRAAAAALTLAAPTVEALIAGDDEDDPPR